METPFKKEIREHRFMKELAKEEDVKVCGSKGGELEELVNQTTEEADELLMTNEPWVREKLENVRDYLGDFTDEQIKEVFFKGLATNVTQYFRLFKNVSPAELDQLSNADFRQNLIQSFFADFVLSLRSYKKQELTPNNALELAGKSYWHDPKTLIELKRRFPDVNESIITHAAVHNPVNPEAFINKALDNIDKLKQKFPDVNEGIITQAAVGYPSDPEGFVKRTLDNIDKLKQKFPDVNESIITRAATYNPSDPEKFIKEKIQKK
jgi:hypothetical protein